MLSIFLSVWIPFYTKISEVPNFKQKNCPVGIAGFSAFPTGLFVRSYIQLHPANPVAHFSCQHSIGNFADPLFAEIGVSVIAVKVCFR